MKRNPITFSLILFVFFISSAYLFPEENMFYGYISYLEGKADVKRLDGSVTAALINLPIVPGDRIITGTESRCEIQFDNGTMMRLDKATELKVETILAKSLTTRQKLTTLRLKKGQLYSIVQTYNLEIFQVVTPNAAVLMKNASTNVIDVDEINETSINVLRGKVKVKYGTNKKNLRVESIKSKKGFRVTKDQQFVASLQRDTDFIMWNRSVNKNFKELHHGKSKVPKAVYRYNKAITHFAEKWSSLYGEWIYDELFGYVWKPFDKSFKYYTRPFFHAEYVWVNGELFVVPTQPWGWAPAHLGTWVFLKNRGWTWIPGTAFTSGFQRTGFSLLPGFSTSFYFPGLMYWVDQIYGGYGFYCMYREYGLNKWRAAYERKFKLKVSRPIFKNVPKQIKMIIKKMNSKPVDYLNGRFAKAGSTTIELKDLRIKSTPSFNKVKPGSSGGKVSGEAVRSITPVASGKQNDLSVKKGSDRIILNWSPDAKWARSRNIKIEFSSKTNDVLIPKFNISSSKLTKIGRYRLRTSNRSFLLRTAVNNAIYSGFTGISGSDSSSTSATSSGSSKGTGGGQNSASAQSDAKTDK